MASQLLRLPERFQVALQKAAADKVQAAATEKLQVSTDGSTTPADQIRDITNRGLTADAAKIKATGIGYGSTTTTSAKPPLFVLPGLVCGPGTSVQSVQ